MSNLIEIKSRYDRPAIFAFECENNSIRKTVEAALERGINLEGADLYGANLSGANLSGSNLYKSDLYGANLYLANLAGTILCGANLYNANLYKTDLYGAHLHGVSLSGASLYRTKLCGAILCYDDKGDWICDGKYHHITNIGREGGTLELYSCGEKGWLVRRGCFTGSKEEFLRAVSKTHGDNEHGKKYRTIVELLCGE